MKTLLNYTLTGILFIVSVSCSKRSETEWQNLYNGKDLTGWIQRNGQASFEAKDSMIVGTTIFNTPNSFLCTEKNYGDFILEFDFMVDPSMNSGVQFRSLSLPEYQNGRVHGYQIEIDPSPRRFTGGIYDEARNGWLYPVNEPEQESARNAFINGQWNKARVEAIGNHIKTWINGVPVTNLYDETTDSGFIALQVHAITDSSMLNKQISWKNIRILTKDLDKFTLTTTAPSKAYLVNKLTEDEIEGGWKLLFDGNTSNGWRRFGSQSFPIRGWVIEKGMMTVVPDDSFVFGEKRNIGGDIITMDEYSDFDLQLQAKLEPGANSGVKYFVKETDKSIPGSGLGLEYQVLDLSNVPENQRDSQKGTLAFASLYDLIKAEGVRANPVGQWNNIRIISKGKHVEHWLNGFKVAEFERGSADFRKRVADSKFKGDTGFGEEESGHILLQDHGGGVSFRSIKIKVLN